MKVTIKGTIMSAKSKEWKNETATGISHQIKVFDKDADALYTIKIKDTQVFEKLKKQIGTEHTFECQLYSEKYSLSLK